MPKNNNDYDDIFKTLKYNHKRLFISLINKAFNKSYPLNIVPTILLLTVTLKTQMLTKSKNVNPIY